VVLQTLKPKMFKVIVLLAALAAFASADSCTCYCNTSGVTYSVSLSGNCDNCYTNCVNYCGLFYYYGYSCSTTCFPADATVELKNGSTKTMAELQVGDVVRVGANEFSEVYMFSHRYEDAVATFVTIATEKATLKITGDHYIYVNGKLAAAETVKVGDVVVAADGSEATVTAVGSESATGLYNPHTMSGDIVVNGVKTSTYTSAVAPTLAHVLLWPVRALYAMGADIFSGNFDEGSALLAAIAPRGRTAY
jgi:hypothetical protein